MLFSTLDGDCLHTQCLAQQYAKTSVDTAGDASYSAAAFVHGLIARDTNGAARTDTLPSAADIVGRLQALSSSTQALSSVRSVIFNNGGHTLTLQGGAGTSLHGPATVEPGRAALFHVTCTSATAGAEAVAVLQPRALVAPPPPGISTRAVADILDGTYFNPSTSTTIWSNQTPIAFQRSLFRYQIRGSRDKAGTDRPDGGGTWGDSTLDGGGLTYSSVLFSETANGFLDADGVYLELRLNWMDWQDGRLQVVFGNTSTYDAGYDRSTDTFAIFLLNSNTASDPRKMMWQAVTNADGIQTNHSLALSQASIDAIAASNTGDIDDAVRLQFVRLDSRRIEARLYYDASNYQSLVANTTGSDFTSLASSTNNDGIFVGDITYMLINELSDANIDTRVEYVDFSV